MKSSGASDNGLAVSDALVACDVASREVVFGFDVRHGIYVADLTTHRFGGLDLSSPLPLAIYNEFKLRQSSANTTPSVGQHGKP